MSKRIVIIGGMGPQASLELHRRIITGAAKAGAKDNEDYPEILHASIPITDFISSGDSERGFAELVQALDKLRLHVDDSVIIACNTVHLLLPKLKVRYKVKFLSLIDAVVENVMTNQNEIIGLIASPTTIKTKLYEQPLSASCKVLLPTSKEIDSLELAIRHIIANGNPDGVRHLVEPLIQRMLDDGAKQVILGCTELSVMFSNNSGTLVDPLTIIVEDILERTRK